jgi:hypothetical protein
MAVVYNRVGNFLYNCDRAIASLIWGVSQETISSEVGRIARGEKQVGEPLRWGTGTKLAIKLSHWLDRTPSIWGVDHTAKAIQHADKLDAVDDGEEK